MLKVTNEEKNYSSVIFVTAIALLGLLVYKIDEVISPLVLTISVVFMLSPFRDKVAARRLIGVTIFFFALWFLKIAGNLLIPFVLSTLFAYLFDPVVDFFVKKDFNRDLIVYIVTLIVAIVITVVFLILVPTLAEEIQQFIKQIPIYTDLIRDFITIDLLSYVERFDIPTDELQTLIIQEATPKIKTVFTQIFTSISTIASGISSIFDYVLNLILTPILSFYFLKDWDELKEIGKVVAPKLHLDGNKGVNFSKIDNILSNYFRGQLLVSTIIIIFITTFLLIFKFKYAVMLGILAGVLNVIPYFGFLVSFCLGTLVSFLSPQPLTAFATMSIIYFSVQFLEATVIAPKVMGDKLGLNPLLIIVAILGFPLVFGFIGLLVAIPAIAIIKVWFDIWYEKNKEKMLQIEQTETTDLSKKES
ncbi:MAG: AI-2E family transporter [Calditrichaeota bacterium]|nr:MAG: AI-2E family transporter [Calditrichota bacterium]